MTIWMDNRIWCRVATPTRLVVILAGIPNNSPATSYTAHRFILCDVRDGQCDLLIVWIGYSHDLEGYEPKFGCPKKFPL